MIPEWAISVLVSIASLAAMIAALGVAWGVMSERVANLKELTNGKASRESLGHLEERLNEIKSMLEHLLMQHKRDDK